MAADQLFARLVERSTEPKTFYPPKQIPLMARLVQSISYVLARILYKAKLSVSEESVAKVRAIDSNTRMVLVCNHPTLEDGMTLFVLSARIGQLFHYVVAYEAFDGLMGWFIQRLGCYSIRRGVGDRTSISQTLTLLKQPDCRLVIFPEGGCSYQNDTIMPFRPGAIQLPMSALAQMAKKTSSPEQAPDVFVVPISLKYRYRQPMRQVIEKTLSQLEERLKITPDLTTSSETKKRNYRRLRRVANQVILRIEQEAGLVSEDQLNWNQRINRLRQIFIEKCETALEIKPNLNVPMRERVYRVQAMLDETEPTEDEKALRTELLGPEGLTREEVYWDTVRLLNFDAIYDGYVAEAPTPERFLDTLTRIEREVFHLEHAPPKAPRKACFYIGDPINLKDYLEDYQRDRTATIDQLSDHLRDTMQRNLGKMSRPTTEVV
ncbi:Acyltransferase domain protein [Synechococcus sp. PCC 7335]|uniref:1-acyl-sn-glycerol-3-phosphate acyltransferase n=1 Tax=Synechococcus sp. (strain ATCC 29403 / PCC 7335) TaxID=91464 RepID=UPI00017EC730|nr:1-acyl-sn-glycerol-3-phosphate acyltransferase [Synechococcus sp. PCC 7335]EDX87243.1 Acyltransferase domain protein [Synechococcus sp. PCC 7335]